MGRLIHLDWGPVPGSYAWVFPKGDLLTVGVIAAKGRPQDTQRYLKEFVRETGLEAQEVVTGSGQVTGPARLPRRCPAAAASSSSATPPGCSSPGPARGSPSVLRSGPAAGRSAVRCLDAGSGSGVGSGSGSGNVATTYRAALADDLLPEMAAGEACLRALEKRPEVLHALITRTGAGGREFARIARGETTLARAHPHLAVRGLVAGLARAPGGSRC